SVKLKYSFSLWRDMIIYSFPLLISGMAGIINDALDKVIIRRVVDSDDPLSVVGVYGASYKIAVLMALFIQMYRFAMEPFFFEKASGKDAKETYSGAMKYFVIYGIILFLGLNLYLSVIQLILPGNYRGSMFIVPIVSMAYLLFGIFVNLSIWYKVNDKTKYGAYLTFLGASITIAINLVFVPRVGVIASAWAHIACYAVMVIASYLLSRKHYPIDYEIGKILSYIALSIAIVMVVNRIEYSSLLREVGFNTLFIIGYILIAEYKDKIVSVFFKRKR
ncbi:MAG: polysaccharide biosynthesis C-terminal domain-containing protein, partial [Bacteroidales bacterium]|nr:polysaccharide biosynthesis C-terminal domain-containing protein [Bacteroidales bacterium]